MFLLLLFDSPPFVPHFENHVQEALNTALYPLKSRGMQFETRWHVEKLSSEERTEGTNARSTALIYSVTYVIIDGGNDVEMIQTADIGIGLDGNDGKGAMKAR